MNSPGNCSRLVVAGGLKTIFPVLMGKAASSSSSAPSKKRKKADAHLQEANLHVLSVLASLCKYLPRGSIDLQRVVKKFAEPDKVERLVELRTEFCLTLDERIVEIEEAVCFLTSSAEIVLLTHLDFTRTTWKRMRSTWNDWMADLRLFSGSIE